MAVTYSIVSGDDAGLFEVVDGKIVAAQDLAGHSGEYVLTLRATQDTTVTITVEVSVDAGRISEITTFSGDREAVTPQSFYDRTVVEAADPNTHPHMGPFTYTAVKDGNWSDPTVWDTGTIPNTNGAVVNYAGFDVTYDIESDVLIKDIHVSGAGTFRVDPTKDTRLWVDTLMVHGTLIMGEAGAPISESTTPSKPRCEIVH